MWHHKGTVSPPRLVTSAPAGCSFRSREPCRLFFPSFFFPESFSWTSSRNVITRYHWKVDQRFGLSFNHFKICVFRPPQHWIKCPYSERFFFVPFVFFWLPADVWKVPHSTIFGGGCKRRDKDYSLEIWEGSFWYLITRLRVKLNDVKMGRNVGLQTSHDEVLSLKPWQPRWTLQLTPLSRPGRSGAVSWGRLFVFCALMRWGKM